MKNLNIGLKLGILSSILIVLLVATALVGILKLDGMNGRINDIVTVSAEKVKLGARMSQDLIDISRVEKNIILARTPEEMEEDRLETKQLQQSLKDREAALADLVDDRGKRKLSEFNTILDRYLDVNQSVTNLAAEGSVTQAMELVENKGRRLSDECENLLKSIVNENDKEMARDKAESDKNYANARSTVIMISFAGIVFAIFLSYRITRLITVPMRKGVSFAGDMAKGNFTTTLEIDQRDEIGVLAEALNEMSESVRAMLSETLQGVGVLSSSSTELSTISEQMAAGAEQTASKSGAVASATEEMSTNMDSISAATEQTTTNVSSVASATEEMTSTIQEIASNTNTTKEMTENATKETGSVLRQVQDLGNSVKSISDVTETIKEISEQTNLLALNATIEAARAGEAGKGFAVVAGEIKDLAKQTSEATEGIKHTVNSIQQATDVTIKGITSVTEVVNNVNKSTNTVASAIEEQSATTKEISENIAQASQGTREVTENVAQGASVAKEIAQDIAQVNQSATDISETGEQVKVSADELNRLAEKLNTLMSRFTT